MLVEIVVDKPVVTIEVIPVAFCEECIIVPAVEKELLDRGTMDITILSGRDDHHEKIVVGTVRNLRAVGGGVIGDLQVTEQLRYYLDGRVLRYEVGAHYVKSRESVRVPGYPKIVGSFTSLHILDPLHRRVVAPIKQVDVPNVDKNLLILQLSGALTALAFNGITIADTVYEGQTITKLMLSNGTTIEVPKPINIKW